MARRGENIRKRSDGRWEGRYIKGRSADGKPCWGYVYGATYTEVREISARKKAEYGIYNLNSTDITFSEISEQWLYSVRQGVKESTFAHYQYTLRHYLQPVFGDFKVSALSEKILEQGLLAVITPVNGLQKPLGATMAQECLSMLRRICKYAAHFHLVRPLEITVKLPQKSSKVLLPFTIEEQKKLQSFVMDSPTPRKIGLLLGFQLGLRIGEICGLKWGDFDLSAGTVTIQRTVTRISCGNGHTKVVVQSPNMLYNQPYSWPIASQLSFFRENICLFIGCSLSDPNIRRLLEITAYNPPKHYAILPMMYKRTDASGAVVPKQFTTKDRLQIENHFYRIGINILWVRDYSAIPTWLHNLNRSIV